MVRFPKIEKGRDRLGMLVIRLSGFGPWPGDYGCLGIEAKHGGALHTASCRKAAGGGFGFHADRAANKDDDSSLRRRRGA